MSKSWQWQFSVSPPLARWSHRGALQGAFRERNCDQPAYLLHQQLQGSSNVERFQVWSHWPGRETKGVFPYSTLLILKSNTTWVRLVFRFWVIVLKLKLGLERSNSTRIHSQSTRLPYSCLLTLGRRLNLSTGLSSTDTASLIRSEIGGRYSFSRKHNILWQVL